MSITCPDGKELVFGHPDTVGVREGDGTSSGQGRRVSIRVFDWWFFVRVAMEYDLGLARWDFPFGIVITVLLIIQACLVLCWQHIFQEK